MENTNLQKSSEEAAIIKKRITEFSATLRQHYQEGISKLLESKGINPQEFIETVINSIKRNPTLLECEPASVFGGVLASAELGLPPNTPYNLSALVPYNKNLGTKQDAIWVKEAQFQIQYQGWIELFGRNDKIKHVTAEMVFDNDEFREVKGLNRDLIHVPTEETNNRGERRGAYAIAYLHSGHVEWVYMSKNDIMKIKAMSKSPAWDEEKDPMGWMWKKCVIKQLAKMLPKTNDMRFATLVQDAEETGHAIKVNTTTKTIELPDMNEGSAKREAEEKSSGAIAGVAGMFDDKAK